MVANALSMALKKPGLDTFKLENDGAAMAAK